MAKLHDKEFICVKHCFVLWVFKGYHMIVIRLISKRWPSVLVRQLLSRWVSAKETIYRYYLSDNNVWKCKHYLPSGGSYCKACLVDPLKSVGNPRKPWRSGGTYSYTHLLFQPKPVRPSWFFLVRLFNLARDSWAAFDCLSFYRVYDL